MFPKNFKKIGYLTKPHGIDGTMNMKTDGNYEDELLEREFLFLSVDGTMIPFSVSEVWVSGEHARVKFTEVSTENDIRLVKGKQVYIPSIQKNSFADPESLEGFEFFDETSGKEGVIKEFEETELNPMLVVESEGKEYLLPFNEDFIIGFDPKARSLRFSLPDGIFDLD